MPTADQVRIEEDRGRPRVMELWKALRPLTSVVRFMSIGAHPDDETSSMLAALAMRDGFNLSFACATRGEGGQNDIGTEHSGDLGALRTAEMERACGVLNMKLYWLSEGDGDRIRDFGLSKSRSETLAKWGCDRTLARLVEIVRTERPDIICPTFLDVPGQHGHHRAITRVATLVMSAAADATYPSNRAPWRISKCYLPSWSGAGRSYDDDEKPPASTLIVPGDGLDPVSGWDWRQIGEQSRSYHRSQGMGRWMPDSIETDWPLHLLEGHVPGPDESLTSGLPSRLSDLAILDGAKPIADLLRSADSAVEEVVAAFADFDAVERSSHDALRSLRMARERCPSDVGASIMHRLEAKEIQLGHVRRLALGIRVNIRFGSKWIHPGDSASTKISVHMGAATKLRTSIESPEGCSFSDGVYRAGPEARPTDPFRERYDPAAPSAPCLMLEFEAEGVRSTCRLRLDDPPVILPKYRVHPVPDQSILNLSGDRRQIDLDINVLHPAGAQPGLILPPDWLAEWAGQHVTITLPENVQEGSYAIPLQLDGHTAHTVRLISYPHIAGVARPGTALFKVCVLSVRLPQVRVGYIGSGNDRIDHWLSMLGIDVSTVSDAELRSREALGAFDSIIVGIFALKQRSELRQAMSNLHDWIRDGGTLVTLYHRPWDNWDPANVPPKWLEFGQPSLRWRVTDENSEVVHIEPDHPVLNFPNRILPRDWEGWDKERGLYFAKSWDKAYRPLLSMADLGEDPHLGSLLAADIGHGRHIHTSLILHHQAEELVPGAFRLLSNMVAARKKGN